MLPINMPVTVFTHTHDKTTMQTKHVHYIMFGVSHPRPTHYMFTRSGK